MKSSEIISRLRAHEPELRAAGVMSLALFGSTARGEQRNDSDIDVVVRLTKEAARGGLRISGGLTHSAAGWRRFLNDRSMLSPSPYARIACDTALKRIGSLPSKNPIRRLEDIVENISLIEEYTRNYSYDNFGHDRKCQDAVERCLLRISEAASKLENSIETIIPDQPWSAIRAVGNVLRHQYDSIDPPVIWNIVSADLDFALQFARRQ